eukprot:CFRG7356T1
MGGSSSKASSGNKDVKKRIHQDQRTNNVVYNVPGVRSQTVSMPISASLSSRNIHSGSKTSSYESEQSRLKSFGCEESTRSDSVMGALPSIDKGDDSRRSSAARKSASMIPKALRRIGSHNSSKQQTATQSLVLTGAYSLRDFTMVERVGTGQLGNVFLCQHTLSGLPVAIKSVSKDILRRADGKDAIRIEKRLLQRLTLTNCPFTVKSYCAFQDNNNFYFVLEYVPGGELDVLMHDVGLFDEPVARFYVAEILLALQHMHQLGYVYRDLRPENVLLGGDGHIRLVDFGSSAKLKPSEISYEPYVWDEEGAEYLSPQVILNRGYGQEVDMWALGCLCYEMLCGETPFKSQSRVQMYQKIRAGDLTFPTDLPVPLSEDCMDFIHQLLNPDIDERLGVSKAWSGPGVDKLFEHPFLSGVDWDALRAHKIEPPYVCHPRESGESGDINGMKAFDTLLFQVSKGRLPKMVIPKETSPENVSNKPTMSQSYCHVGSGSSVPVSITPMYSSGPLSAGTDSATKYFLDNETNDSNIHRHLKDFDAVFRYLPNGLVTTVVVTPSAQMEEIMSQNKMLS